MPHPARGPSFDDTILLRAAVLAGQGAGLLPTPLIETLIDQGRLIVIGQEARIEEFAYYLVTPQTSIHRAKVSRFRQWLLDQRLAP